MRSHWIVSFLCVALLGSATFAQTPKWRHLQGGQLEGASFLDQQRGWIAGDARIHYTQDGGNSWSQADIDEPAGHTESRTRLRGMFVYDDPQVGGPVGLCVGNNGVVLRTVDFTLGERWDDFNPDSRVLNACGQPAVLYDVFMFKNTGYQRCLVVGEDGAVAESQDGGVTWTNIALIPGTLPVQFINCAAHDIYDAYAIHFFEDAGSGQEYQRGIIAAEHGVVLTTEDGGATWTLVHAANPLTACPQPDGNLEWWGMDFDDPTSSSSAAYLSGGVGVNRGFIFRAPHAMNGPWTQSKCYDLLFPGQAAGICGLSTQYGTAVLDPTAVPPRVLSVGYASSLLEYQDAATDFDPCACAPGVPSGCGLGSGAWVQQETQVPTTENPAFRAVAKVSATEAVMAGAFGRIVRYTSNPGGGAGSFDDVGTDVVNRLEAVGLASATEAAVIGQGCVIHYTVDGGLHWTRTTVVNDPGAGNQGRAIAFDDTGSYGIAVGDGAFMARTTQSVDGTWTFVDVEMQTSAQIGDIKDVCFVPGSGTVYAVGSSGIVLKSTDHGEQWSVSRLPDRTKTFHGVSFATDMVGYVVGDDFRGYKTENGGGSWEQVSFAASAEETLYDVATWGDGASAIVVGQLGGVWTNEVGHPRFSKVDWSEIGFPEVREHLRKVEVFEDGDAVRIGGDMGVVLFRDAGTNGDVWTSPRSGTVESLTGLDFLSADEGFAVGGQFVVLKYDDA